MEINYNDIRLANNTLEIDKVCRQKEHLTEFEINSVKARIANVEDRISQQQQYLRQLNDELVKLQNQYSEIDNRHSELIQERRVMLGQTK